jgi:hypothetical protein
MTLQKKDGTRLRSSIAQPDPTGLLIIIHLFQRSLHSACLMCPPSRSPTEPTTLRAEIDRFGCFFGISQH